MPFARLSRRQIALIALPGFLAGCKQKSVPERPVRRFPMRGEVLRLQPASQVAVIKHENIDGWMEAMTMDFPVRDKAQFAKLREGMRIRATVLVQDFDFWLEDIQQE
jgi:protein SCO1/2